MPPNQTILVTGVSSGIGLALARRLWNSPYQVVATARQSSLSRFRNEPFQNTARFILRELDVTQTKSRQALMTEVKQRFGGVDILINNAGISYRTAIEDMTEEDEQQQLATNYLGPIALIREVLPYMRARRCGRIINVSSVGGMMAMPTMGSYSASKFALEGASEALWYELRPWGIYVSLIQPGFINSNSFKHVYMSENARGRSGQASAYRPYYIHMERFVEQLMLRASATPDTVAQKILATLTQIDPPLRIPATIDAHFFSWFRRFAPRRLYHWLLFRNLPGISEWGK